MKTLLLVGLSLGVAAAAMAQEGGAPKANDAGALKVCADPHSLPQSNDRGEGYENKIAEALAHDLGHPPFGHIAEDELNHLVVKATLREEGRTIAQDKPLEQQGEGYEGNAQSFRILTALSIRRPNTPRRRSPPP